jgi:hypothetical protein
MHEVVYNPLIGSYKNKIANKHLGNSRETYQLLDCQNKMQFKNK